MATTVVNLPYMLEEELNKLYEEDDDWVDDFVDDWIDDEEPGVVAVLDWVCTAGVKDKLLLTTTLETQIPVWLLNSKPVMH